MIRRWGMAAVATSVVLGAALLATADPALADGTTTGSTGWGWASGTVDSYNGYIYLTAEVQDTACDAHDVEVDMTVQRPDGSEIVNESTRARLGCHSGIVENGWPIDASTLGPNGRNGYVEVTLYKVSGPNLSAKTVLGGQYYAVK